MANDRQIYSLWESFTFRRPRHQLFRDILKTCRLSSGIYLIGCGGRIVYIGQSVEMDKRSIQSLGGIYHRVSDVTLPWSIAYAPCPGAERNERESTAIRAFAPQFNTSIPSVEKSQLRMPDIMYSAPIFIDQDAECGAFDPQNMDDQRLVAAAIEADPNAKPTWKPSKPRRPTVRRPKFSPADMKEPEWSKEQSDEAVRQLGVAVDGDLRFKINLCDDGAVVTNDGEIIGTWNVDAYDFYCFIPNGAAEVLTKHPFMYAFCDKIAKWHETSGGIGASSVPK